MVPTEEALKAASEEIVAKVLAELDLLIPGPHPVAQISRLRRT